MPTPDETCLADPLALTIHWQDGLVASLSLEWAAGKTRRCDSEAARALQAALTRYVVGGEADWPELPLRWTGVTAFAREVLETLANVPRGQMVSYGWLAARTGRPKAARAVGRVMAQNRFPLLYPCHRVVGAQGALTGFGPGLDMKRALLRLEGALA